MAYKLKAALAAATMLAAGVAAPASALTFTFTPGTGAPGTYSPTTGYTVVNEFTSLAGLVTTGDVQIKVPPADNNGSPPNNSVPSGSSYLSVLAGGLAVYDFVANGFGPVTSLQFDWGSLDDYNTLTIFGTGLGGENTVVIPGTDFTSPANGDRVAPGTNGLFTITAGAGETITGLSFASSANSFEVDRLALLAPVPEPETWAMMIAGFGFVGAFMRRRRTRTMVSFV